MIGFEKGPTAQNQYRLKYIVTHAHSSNTKEQKQLETQNNVQLETYWLNFNVSKYQGSAPSGFFPPIPSKIVADLLVSFGWVEG